MDPYLPYEYTCEGMLERIHAYIQHQVWSIPVLPGELSLTSYGLFWASRAYPLHVPSKGPLIPASGLMAEQTKRWGMREVCCGSRMLEGCWRVSGGAEAESKPFSRE